VDAPPTVQGRPLSIPLAENKPIRKGALFGLHGGHVNCTDGRYVYMRCSKNQDGTPLYNYTLMPTHIMGFFNEEELSSTELAEPFSFTKGFKTLKTAAKPAHQTRQNEFGSLLFDLESDPGEERPLDSAEVESKMTDLMIELMLENEAPSEQFERLGLAIPKRSGDVT
jgi:hypothetical protein